MHPACKYNPAFLPLGILLIAIGCRPGTACAAQQPLWEFGLGVGAITFQDYRGAAGSHAYPVPVPYFLYNGKFLKSDRDGVRGTIFDSDRIELNLSFNATTPVSSSRERSGMPDLKPTIEIGPAVDLHLWRSADARYKFDVRMPLRTAISVEAAPHIIGWTFAPRLNLDVMEPFGYAGWQLGVLWGPLFAERRYHEYFYSVAPRYATASRPAYRAAGGYAGTQTLISASKRFARFWVGAYARYDTLGGAVFADSPLVQNRHYWSAGVGVAWMIHSATQIIDVAD